MLWADATRRPTIVFGLDVPREELERRIEARTRAMFERGAAEEARRARALAQPISTTALRVLGLREAAELPRDEAIAQIAQRTRRYAAYQRKWMRRIPGLVSLPAGRPPAEIADEIVEMARARQRLPARRAG
jgi:tRNA dimethylallyltransferase